MLGPEIRFILLSDEDLSYANFNVTTSPHEKTVLSQRT